MRVIRKKSNEYTIKLTDNTIHVVIIPACIKCNAQSSRVVTIGNKEKFFCGKHARWLESIAK